MMFYLNVHINRMINRHEATGNSAPTTISASHESSTRTPHSSPRALPGTPPQRPRHLSTRARRNNLAFSPNIVIDLSETQSPPRRSNLQPQPQPPLGTGSSLLDNSDVILMEPNEVIDLCTPKPQTPRRRHCIHIECSSHGVLRSRRAITMAPRNTAPTDDGVLQKKCPICLEAIHQPTATICGHVFCRTCIKQAITVNHKCPMCKTKTDKRGLRRIYL